MTRRVLAIRPRALGDVVLVTPALRALARIPDTALDVVTEPPYAPLIEGLPEVRRVWRMGRSARDTLRLGLELSAQRYAMVVDFFGNPRTALLARTTRAPVRAGYDLRGRRDAYTLRVPRAVPPAHGEREYAADVHLRLAHAVGGVTDGADTRVSIPLGSVNEVPRLLAESGIDDPAHTVGLVAAGTWAAKTWPLSHAAVLARRLIEAGWRVLLLTGPGERRVAQTLRRLTPAIHVLPRCDVAALAAVIAKLGAVVGTDSGPRHLAAALGVPTYAWFGPTHPDTWNPRGERHGYWRTELPCRGCDRVACPHWSCLPALAPDTAAARVLEHLARSIHEPAAASAT